MRESDINFETIQLEQLLASLESTKGLKLVILDACRTNPFETSMVEIKKRSISRGLAPVEPQSGLLVAYSAKHGQVALDGDSNNSPYTTALVKRLSSKGIEIRRVFDLVRDDVMESTDNQQQPFTYGSLSGRQDYYFSE